MEIAQMWVVRSSVKPLPPPQPLDSPDRGEPATEVRKLHTLVEPFLLLAADKVKKGMTIREKWVPGSVDIISNLMGQAQTFVINPAQFNNEGRIFHSITK